MFDFRDTDLWQRSLAEHPTDTPSEAEARERVRAAFTSFRERAGQLAGEIPQSLKDFTVHDLTHLDALWETASLIAGPGFQPNPLEAFVLGGAFLIHDLGMALAAYPKGLDELKAETVWRDAIASRLADVLGRAPTRDELEAAPLEAVRAATTEALRELHARRAEELALIQFRHKDSSFFLIEDADIRRAFGPLIGRIAHSHWWPVPRLPSEFTTPIGAAHWAPETWTVDPLPLAALLRVADASHLDARRAPGFLRALRKPSGTSDDHWAFQQNLQKAQLRNDKLLFTSGHPFAPEEASAWWLCYDTLQIVDRELQHVDALLSDLGKTRFAAKGVLRVEDPARLTQFIRTEGWIPVDAKIKVTDVASLVRRLGGEELYGDDPHVALRELIQNASDAVRARRYIENREPDWGRITVRLLNEGSETWLEVEDTGIGMSRSVLTGPFLDFGTSYWGSSLMIQELPGLASKGFQSTGKYGIGFFSVFMLGTRVQVITRRSDEALEGTKVLEFEKGLAGRPLLRPASSKEFSRDGGTRVRVRLDQPPTSHWGLLFIPIIDRRVSLSRLCEWLCPALEVDLYTENGDGRKERALRASDWLHIPGEALLTRICLTEGDPRARMGESVRSTARLLREVHDESRQVVGRVALVPFGYGSGGGRLRLDGVVTSGGLRCAGLSGIAGLLLGTATRAARDFAVPVVGLSSLTPWASVQAKLLAKYHIPKPSLGECAGVVIMCGGAPNPLPVAYTSKGWLTLAQLQSFLKGLDEIVLTDLYDVQARCEELRRLRPQRNVVLLPFAHYSLLESTRSGRVELWPPHPESFLHEVRDAKLVPWNYERHTVRGAIVLIAKQQWGCSVEDVFRFANLRYGTRRRVIGTEGKRPISAHVHILRRPGAPSDGHITPSVLEPR